MTGRNTKMYRDFIAHKGECFYRRETNQKGEMQEVWGVTVKKAMQRKKKI